MKPLPAPSVVWETLRHLRPRQIAFQLGKRILPERIPRAFPIRWRLSRPLVRRAKNTERIHFDGRATFSFNNDERVFAGDWNDPGARKLWLYNLHYMNWIFDPHVNVEEWIEKWIEGNPFERKGNGWEPYPVSLRLFNWCKHYSLGGEEPDRSVLESMGHQAAWLFANLEFHLDGNHLLENLLALTYVGFFLDGEDSSAMRSRERILKRIEKALSEQFLPDGGHYELSPMYHAILLERLLDLLDSWPVQNGFFLDLKVRIEAVAMSALRWLDIMSVGGRFALFNDSAYDTAPESAMLIDYGSKLLGYRSLEQTALVALEPSGYYRAEAGPLSLIFDGGRLGPDHQMGHAQGDMLSICLWIRGIPFLVHPGNFEYLAGEMRDYCRSTASHNTLTVDGNEQADWWSSHRVGWRGKPRDVSAVHEPEMRMVRIKGSHDGFSRLAGNPVHTREVELSPDSLSVRDEVSGNRGRINRVYYHFHPDCILSSESEGIRISSSAGAMMLASTSPMKLVESWYCPEFGIRIRNKAVVVEFIGPECRTVMGFRD